MPATHIFATIQMFIDAIEVVPPPEERNEPAQFASRSDRLDGQRVVIGQKYCDLLANAQIFVVGSGAIGCEMLKNLALSGVGTNGRITITDNDLIEKSNLNRQFLFRAHNIGVRTVFLP
jgi:tRNA A37 threonylcarbamoyladenosine dehydratase